MLVGVVDLFPHCRSRSAVLLAALSRRQSNVVTCAAAAGRARERRAAAGGDRRQDKQEVAARGGRCSSGDASSSGAGGTRAATAKAVVVLLNKPYDVLCQFTDTNRSGGGTPRATLASYVSTRDVYPAGRLDRDSEGLIVLTNSGPLQARISSPQTKWPKTYWVQVEGDVTDEAQRQLRAGVNLKDGLTAPAEASIIPEPMKLWPRDPPIRHRASIPTTWLSVTLREGRNRQVAFCKRAWVRVVINNHEQHAPSICLLRTQVRRMTAAVGFPTLRLVRYAVGPWTLQGLAPGESRQLTEAELVEAFRWRAYH